MLHLAAVLVALVLAPGAFGHSVAVGPDGFADPIRGEPYYVWLVVGPPEAPSGAGSSDNCGAGSRPALLASAMDVANDIAAWDPMANFGGGTWFPTCVSGSVLECDSSAGVPCMPMNAPTKTYVAYDVTTGRYYLQLDANALPGMPMAATIAITGSTGVGMLMDCVGCPPPVCCDN